MKVKDLTKKEEDLCKEIVIDGGGEVYGVEVDHVSDFAVWLKVIAE